MTTGKVDSEFWPEPSGGGPPESSSARVLLGVGVVLVGVLGAFSGLAAAGLTGGKHSQEVARPPSSSQTTTGAPSTAPAPPSTTEPAGSSTVTEPPSSTVSSSTTTLAPSSTTTTPASTTTTTRTTTTRPSTTVTVPATSTPTTTVYPAAFNVAYSQDGSGALVVPRNGRAIIMLSNTGGEPGQWVFMVNTPGYQLSQTRGVLDGGSSVTVTVSETQGKTHTGSLSLIVAPGDRYLIDLRTP